MATTISNPLRHAAERALAREQDAELGPWILALRPLSWDLIARELERSTAGDIRVSGNTVHAWSNGGSS